jgi:formate dehydrogenase iron-sulfur subunit
VRLTANGLAIGREEVAVLTEPLPEVFPSLLPGRPLQEGEQYRFHFDMTKCIGCRSCEVACNEQNGNPASIFWRRIGELEGGSYPHTRRHYLSMGCNHCLDADCLRGCPVEAYKKDSITGIVLHSADACIGCQYCVWNCHYVVPQFNPERGVVGKCDMCKGRLDHGLEPACVNACPEAAIEIEIVNKEAWRADFASAESPGMPPAGHTLSTTRITLPTNADTGLERVDSGQIQPEHAHLSLVFMTTLMQAVAGALLVLQLFHELDAIRLSILLTITVVALNISTMHLGRPAYAWRALRMWRRSWLSREVLFFTLFFLALSLATLCTMTPLLHRPVPAQLTTTFSWAAIAMGFAGTIASAYIYLVPARPSWNMKHTPVDFLLTAALLGVLLGAVLCTVTAPSIVLALLHEQSPALISGRLQTEFAGLAAAAWLLNQTVRLYRLRSSSLFEGRAAFSLLSSVALRPYTIASLALVAFSVALVAMGHPLPALGCGWAGVLLARYLFFVSVVPLNMGLTFIRTRHA